MQNPAPALAPYAIPLDAPKLEELIQLLGDFGLHGLVGLFSAAASVPGFSDAEQWLPELIHHVAFEDEARFRRAVELAMRVQGHVRSAFHDGRSASLVPDALDVAACRQWSRGYAALLVRVDAAHRTGNVVQAAFAIQALAEVPQFVALLDVARRDAQLQEFRAALAEHVASLHAAWAGARAQVATVPEPLRAAPKVGRNDPCPCGSGKKHKKCCAAA